MVTEKDIKDQMELMQDDLTCILDGIEDETVDYVCQVVVERMNILISKLCDKK